MTVAELRKRLADFPVEMQVVVTPPEIFPCTRKLEPEKVRVLQTERPHDGGRVALAATTVDATLATHDRGRS